MAILEKQRAKHRAALANLNAQYRAWAERARAARQRGAKATIREKLNPKKETEVKIVKKLHRGRPVRWPGLCHACMMRHFQEAGGPSHKPDLCPKTQKHIKSLA